jgi:predicted RNA methylase
MAKLMKRKELEQHLQELDGFSKPKILLEQYETSIILVTSIIINIIYFT